MTHDFFYWLYPNSKPVYWFNFYETCKAWDALAQGSTLAIEDGMLVIDGEQVDPDSAWGFYDSDKWQNVFENLHNRADYSFLEDGKVNADILKALVRLMAEYRRWYCASGTASMYDEKGKDYLSTIFNNAFEDLMNKCERAYEEYVPILKLYEQQEANLLAQIKTTSTANSRFNDTPQNGGSWEDDNHTTNLTQMTSDSATDGDTPIRRLEEVRRLWRSVMSEMVDYLAEMLIPEDNI